MPGLNPGICQKQKAGREPSLLVHGQVATCSLCPFKWTAKLSRHLSPLAEYRLAFQRPQLTG
jgi:hypothetical protein